MNHSILCNTLKLFSWKIAHGALYTQEKLSRWGVSDGKRPFCSKFETLVHVFWECPSIYKVICWVLEVAKEMLGGHVLINKDCFLYGSSATINACLWARVWYLFVVTRTVVWNQRCSYIFEKVFVSEDILLLRIRDKLRLRLVVARKRWSRHKFDKVWINGKSFISVVGENIQLNLPGLKN